MKSRIIKKIFATLIVATIIIQSISVVLAEVTLNHDSGTEATFGITILEPDGKGYMTGTGGRIIYRTYVVSGQTKDYTNAVYCLDRDKLFPTETNTQNTSTVGSYKSDGTLTDSTIGNKTKIANIANIMYVKNQTDREAWFNEVLIPAAREMSGQLYEDTEDSQILEYYNNKETNPNTYITDDEIFVAQQLAIWNITNNASLGMITLKTNTTENKTTGWGDPTVSEKENKYPFLDYYRSYLESDTLTSEKSSTIKAKLWSDVNSSVWYATSDQDRMQPLLYVSKTPLVPYDVALSKTIIGYKSKNATSYTEVSNREKGAVEKNANKQDSEDKQEKEALGNISIDDYVKYKITIYNQGSKKVRVNTITDYLPDGLEYVASEETSQYNWVKTGNRVITQSLQNTVLEPQKTVSVEIICQAKTSGELKNYAEVTTLYDESGSNVINGYNSENTPKEKDSIPGNYYKNETYVKNEDDTDYEIIDVKGEFNLGLNKYIKSVNGVPVTDRSGYTDEQKTNNKVSVKPGDLVVYTIEVKNKGLKSGYVTEITDFIPEGLAYVPSYTESTLNRTWDYSTISSDKVKKLNTLNITPNSVLTDTNIDVILGNSQITIDDLKDTKLESNKTATVQIACIVLDGTTPLKNAAEITAHKDEDGNTQKENLDINSTPGNYPSQEEDDDGFDIVIPEKGETDLALKKFVSSINGQSRKVEAEREKIEPQVDVTPLKNGEKNAKYTITKDPVTVQQDDVVTFTLRVYNEGKTDEKDIEVTDTIPEGLQFVKDAENNENWKTYDENGNETSDVSKIKTVKATISSTIDAFDNGDSLDYEDLKIDLKVVKNESVKITNLAQITDMDQPDRDEEDKEDEDSVIPVVYDLALKKFVTKVNDKEVTTREPKVTKKEDGTLEYTDVTDPYTVFKDDIVEYTIRIYNEGNADTYAEEVFDDLPEGIEFLPDNEINKKYGWKMYKSDDGVAIMDSKNGTEVDDIKDALYITTDYLSKDVNEDKIIKAYQDEKDVPEYTENSTKVNNPDYQDIKVVFKVTEDNVTQSKNSRTIINTANVTYLTDKNGKSVVDKDVDDNNDKEYIGLNYFDLSLLKYVSKVIVTEDGATRETETGYNGTENPEPMVKVEVNRKKIASTSIKYVYTLKVTNQGEIDGFATELTDRIPAGMAFYAEDNTEYGWKIKEAGIVTTDYLAKKTIKPGQSQEVKITLRWENSESNLGQKTNVAEITESYNEYGAPDIDSTPNNSKDGEDDQDSAIAIISIKTGSAPMYIGLIIICLSTVAIGGYIIKKKVL